MTGHGKLDLETALYELDQMATVAMIVGEVLDKERRDVAASEANRSAKYMQEHCTQWAEAYSFCASRILIMAGEAYKTFQEGGFE